MAVAKFLKARGATICFADDHIKDVEGFLISAPESISIDEFDLVIPSPGWSQNHPLLSAAQSIGIRITNEIDLAWELRNELLPNQRWLALTGTNGKTTTVEMAAKMLLAAGINAVACGNVGHTVIEAVASSEKYEVLVLELSSFQLHWLQNAKFSAAAILNIAQDHLDWHGTFAEYAKVKGSILDRCEIAILNSVDAEVMNIANKWQGKKVFFSLETPAAGELGVVEDLLIDRAFVANSQEAAMIAEVIDVTPSVPHNVANALAAAGLVRAIGVDYESIRRALQKFSLGRHRIEKICEKGGVTWVNDSKATNPHAAIASLLSTLSAIWIAGGLAKGADMTEMIKRCKPRIKCAILIGVDRELIASQLRSQAPEIEIIFVDPPANYSKDNSDNSFMESVTKVAAEHAKSGDTVLLAPACASMDQFISYSDRGDRFVAAARKVCQ